MKREVCGAPAEKRPDVIVVNRRELGRKRSNRGEAELQQVDRGQVSVEESNPSDIEMVSERAEELARRTVVVGLGCW